MAIVERVISESERIGYLPTLAEGLTIKGNDLADAGDQSATSILDRAAYAAESCGDDRTFAEVATTQIYRIAFTDPVAAERWASLADAALRRIGGDRRLDSWRLNNLGVLRYIQGRMDEAYVAVQKSLALKTSSLGPTHLDVAIGIKNAGVILLAMDRTDEALAKLDEALVILRRWVPPDDAYLAEAESDRGDVLSRLGRYAEAKDAYTRTLQIFTKRLSPTSGLMAEPLNGLARIAFGEGDLNRAFDLFQKAERLCDAGTCLPNVAAEACFGLARALTRLGRDAVRAQALAQRALHTYPLGPYFAPQRQEIEIWLAGPSHTTSATRHHAARRPHPLP
jgi:tetratricopeptide (TPR) repeat protein